MSGQIKRAAAAESEHFADAIDPISRSAKLFCQGEAGAIGLSRIATSYPLSSSGARHDA
jgi:hypothetical protein